jgi:hypothetical protein
LQASLPSLGFAALNPGYEEREEREGHRQEFASHKFRVTRSTFFEKSALPAWYLFHAVPHFGCSTKSTGAFEDHSCFNHRDGPSPCESIPRNFFPKFNTPAPEITGTRRREQR